MSLPVPNLDDRRFQDLVDEAKRLIPTFCPEWTNHNVSDPGVALIELFAWMTEMSVYRINQVPDAFYTHMLNLLGFERFPAAAARAHLTFWLSAPQDIPVVVPANTPVGTSGEGGQLRIFSTVDDLDIHQPELVAALTSTSRSDAYTDVWENLSLQLGAVTCFASDPVTPGDCLYLGFRESVAGNALQLSITANVEGIGVIPDDPPMVWEVWQGEGWIPVSIPKRDRVGQPGDTTGGLNRNGTILMLVPNAHEPLTLGAHRAYWMRARLLPTAPGQPAYRTSPQLLSAQVVSVGGTVEAEHSNLVHGEMLGVSTGKPDQVFVLSNQPILPRSEREVVTVTTETGVDEWEEVDSFIRSGPTDRHYVLDSTTGEVRFGPLIRYSDGTSRQHGAAPPEQARVAITAYRWGGGARGNVGSGTLNSLRASIPYIAAVTNLAPATGGVDAETVENAKRRGPLSIRSGARAVTVSDFERLASEADAAIARARCLAPVDSGGAIRLLLVPKIEEPAEMLQIDDFALPDTMMATVGAYLDERRILGSKIEIGTPFYQGVTIAALLAARPGRPVNLVRDRAMAALYRYLNPLTGGPDGQGWPFDADLNAASVFQLLEAIDGVDRVDEVLFFEYDLRNHVRVGFGKELVKLGADSLFLSTNHQVVVR
ncbi:MAG TPA: putative baseplate assembly protein [Ilumatobacter sp.]